MGVYCTYSNDDSSATMRCELFHRSKLKWFLFGTSIHVWDNQNDFHSSLLWFWLVSSPTAITLDEEQITLVYGRYAIQIAIWYMLQRNLLYFSSAEHIFVHTSFNSFVPQRIPVSLQITLNCLYHKPLWMLSTNVTWKDEIISMAST